MLITRRQAKDGRCVRINFLCPIFQWYRKWAPAVNGSRDARPGLFSSFFFFFRFIPGSPVKWRISSFSTNRGRIAKQIKKKRVGGGGGRDTIDEFTLWLTLFQSVQRNCISSIRAGTCLHVTTILSPISFAILCRNGTSGFFFFPVIFTFIFPVLCLFVYLSLLSLFSGTNDRSLPIFNG